MAASLRRAACARIARRRGHRLGLSLAATAGTRGEHAVSEEEASREAMVPSSSSSSHARTARSSTCAQSGHPEAEYASRRGGAAGSLQRHAEGPSAGGSAAMARAGSACVHPATARLLFETYRMARGSPHLAL